ncbi:MAG: NUDIX domain-containing protein [Brevinematia bacterium]
MEIEIRLEAILFNKDNKLLLIEHEKNSNRYWVLPGGHLEPMEKFEQCLIRELKEELSITNLKVSDLSFVDEYINKEKNRHVVKIGFICQAEEKELSKIKIPENETTIKNFKFFSSSEILLSMEKFYPDKSFFIELINKIKNGEKNG